jgi:hypothetical protein
LSIVLDSLWNTTRQVALVLGPLAVVAVALHLVERGLSSRLLSRLGWGGVWLTGWIGVPIHELSHAAACLLFGHRLKRVRLFAPDRRTGRLGGVDHAFDPKSPYQQLGRFFIGVAPLVGGAGALWLLTGLIGPAGVVLAPASPAGDPVVTVSDALAQSTDLLAGLLDGETLGNPFTWLYLYLCLCVGAHMAPSGTDLKGGWPGFLLLLALVLAGNLVVGLAGGSTAPAERLALSAVTPLLVMLTVALVLGLALLGLVTLLTAVLPRRTL